MDNRLFEQFNSSITESFFRESTINAFDKYEIMEEAMEGEFGPMYKVTPQNHDPATVRIYCLKTIHLNRVSRVGEHQEEIRNEITSLKALDHPNIIKLYEVFYNNDDVHMILEYTRGEDLYSRCPYTERQAARITSQLASAIAHMHENGIIHRNLKFETIVFEHSGTNAAVKVTDFGFSRRFQAGKHSKIHDSGMGAIYTMAPEVLKGDINNGNWDMKSLGAMDNWSLGVLVFMLVSSQIPFYAKRSKNMASKIIKAKYEMDGPVWESISNGAKHLIQHLLVADPFKRYDSQQVLEHIWVEKWAKRDDMARPSDDILQAVDDSLLQYKQTSMLKKLALNIIAYKSTTQEIITLRKLFDSIDTSHNGTIDFQEFREGLRRSRFAEEELEQIFESIDIDHSGQIQYSEFLAATLEARGYLEEERIAEAFQTLDRDGSGFIDKDKLSLVLGETCTAEQAEAIIRDADKNNDGMISYDEFFDVFRDKTMILAAEVGDFEESTDISDDFDDLEFAFDPNSM